MNKDKITTWVGAILSVLYFALKAIFKIDIPIEIQAAFEGIIIWLVGYFAYKTVIAPKTLTK